MRAAGVIVKYKSLVLLAKRIESHKGFPVSYGGYWSIFAGSREPPSEPPRVCAARELFEESGIKTLPSDLQFCKTIYKSGGMLDLFYIEFEQMPQVTLNFEHTESGWFEIDLLKSFPYQIDPPIVKAITSINI
jgi:8-oxo-dGTP pyrophosphatase MutT (NUDIX family)